MFSVLDATLTVSYDEATGEAVLAGSILAQSNYHASDVPEFTLTINCVPAHLHIEFDTEGADFAKVYNDYELIEVYDEGGVIVFDALNSYDRTIKVTLNPKKTESVENVAEKTVNAAKRIENGMLIIEKNGVKMNILGTRIK